MGVNGIGCCTTTVKVVGRPLYIVARRNAHDISTRPRAQEGGIAERSVLASMMGNSHGVACIPAGGKK
jgi:hypothetical protein